MIIYPIYFPLLVHFQRMQNIYRDIFIFHYFLKKKTFLKANLPIRC